MGMKGMRKGLTTRYFSANIHIQITAHRRNFFVKDLLKKERVEW